MIRHFLACILSLFAFAGLASAHDVTLDGEQCTNTKICYDIPNSANDAIDIYAIITHPYVYLYVNGDQFKGTLPGSYPYPFNIVNLPMTDPMGRVVYLTATFEHHTTCTRYCMIHWTLTGGSILGLPL